MTRLPLAEQVARRMHPTLWAWLDQHAPEAKDEPTRLRSLAEATEIVKLVRRQSMRGRA